MVAAQRSPRVLTSGKGSPKRTRVSRRSDTPTHLRALLPTRLADLVHREILSECASFKRGKVSPGYVSPTGLTACSSKSEDCCRTALRDRPGLLSPLPHPLGMDTVQVPAPQQHGTGLPPGGWPLMWAIITVVIAVVPLRIFDGIDTWTGLLLLGVVVLAVWWTVRAFLIWRKTQRGRRALASGATVSALLVYVLLAVEQEPIEAVERVSCDFEPVVFGVVDFPTVPGTRWLRVDPDDPGQEHIVQMDWGAFHADLPLDLAKPRYLTFTKRDWITPDLAATVSPAARLTCGTGRLPSDADVTEVTGRDLWTRRP